MGCSNFKEDSSSEKSNFSKNIAKKFEEYPILDFEYFNLYYYQLLWKIRPICFFQLKEEDKINKKAVNNFNALLKQKIIIEINNIEYLIRNKLIIIYIHIENGVIITRNKNKVNYYLMNYIQKIIDICLVDISNVNLLGGEKFSIYELKNQSKYFFNMNNKEIDFSNRNELISMGKNEEILDKENIIEDEELDEKNKLLKSKEIVIKMNKNDFIKGGNNEENESTLNPNANNNKEEGNKNKKLNKQKSMKLLKRKITTKIKGLNIEKEILNDIETFKPRKNIKNDDINLINLKKKITKSVKLNVDKINMKKIRKINIQSKLHNKQQGTTNINNIQININITNNHNNINVLSGNYKNTNISSLYKIQDKTLILKTYNFTKELNQELNQIFFESNSINDNKDYSPYDFIYYTLKNEEKTKVKRSNKNLDIIINNIDKNKEKKINGFIIIHNRFKIPFDQRKSKNIINKIIFDVDEFYIESTFHLKEFIDMITNYKNLIQIKFGQNINNSSNSYNLLFWKYLKKIFQENFSIRWVSLKESSLDDNVTEIFLSSLLMKRIRYLNLSNNKITNKAMYFLNKFLIKNQT